MNKARAYSEVTSSNPDRSLLSGFACVTKTLPTIYYKFMTSLTCRNYHPRLMKRMIVDQGGSNGDR